ncbi:MAG: hypothetical protein CSA64_00980 [Arachnia propionica]|nr:MAG: hypothetical protein CSA64_00980 [Arachnia propionica]
MTNMMSKQFVVGLTPVHAAARLARARRARRFQLITAALSGLLLAAYWYWLGAELPVTWLIVGWLLWAVALAVGIGVATVRIRQAKRDLAAIGDGNALVLDSNGITYLHPDRLSATWEQVHSLNISGSSFAAGPDLVLKTTTDATARVPLSFLDADPGAIDAAVTAHSRGRIRLDAAGFDRAL